MAKTNAERQKAYRENKQDNKAIIDSLEEYSYQRQECFSVDGK